MLVLSRKKQETIVIDGNIEIEVLQVKGNSVRLGVKAPRDVKVLRGELKPFGMAPAEEITIELAPELDTLESVTFAGQAG